ncbi:hypothetical protein GCM10025878_08670 [Leuconostoc gasicomitatum]|uniref:glycosyltransferase family A protein n=1 Tax=Leuconostoc TaxID=1243 RepID=UPI0001DB5B9C|nr:MULTISPECIES: glycosyltransferase family 2 protein [Leuconostoc]MBZ5952764.1 glycosyltransferase family 2 protein [Leuconostoc gasicomitatum]MBZ6008537.1 glycosyltransferase family 2 protein [Leuconostoc gelidum subsp. aenigmaticum]CBL91356.1 Glycosyltransferase [Leuconostoc gasicomitatum LMG 18811]CUW08557.1 Glycosyltransferase [Leuconostoc inhae]CUW12216.1 Glycosyltransferase [Leuconostoc inhae]
MSNDINKGAFFSIIVPMFNSERYIAHTINSIVEQSYSDWELILVDDGSTDDSFKVARKSTENVGHKVKMYSKSNSGLAETRNYGTKYIQGNYILFVDSDDYIDVDLLFILNEYIVKRNQPDILVFDYGEFDDGSNKVKLVTHFDKQLKRYGEVIWNKCFNVSFYIKNNFQFNKGITYEDTAIIHVIMALAKSIVKVEKVGYFYRRERIGSITSNKLDEEVDNRMLALDKFEENIQKYTQNSYILNKKLNRMNYFLSLSWIYLLLDYQNVSNHDDSYKKIVKKIKKSKIRLGIFKSRIAKDIILYLIVIISLDLKFDFIIKKISRMRSLGQ